MKKTIYLFIVLLGGCLLSACNNRVEDELDFKDYPFVVDTIQDSQFYFYENSFVYEGELQIQDAVFTYRFEQKSSDMNHVKVSLDTNADESKKVSALVLLNDNELTIKDFPCNMTLSLIDDANTLSLTVIYTDENDDVKVAGIKIMAFINN